MSSERFEGIIAYSEFDGKVGPVVRAHYPESLFPDDLKRLAAMCMPSLGQQTDILEEGTEPDFKR